MRICQLKHFLRNFLVITLDRVTEKVLGLQEPWRGLVAKTFQKVHSRLPSGKPSNLSSTRSGPIIDKFDLEVKKKLVYHL